MSNDANHTRTTRPSGIESKRPPRTTIGMSIQQESILYGRNGRQGRRYY